MYNETGDMLAQAVTGTPGHVNAMADAVGHFIRLLAAATWQKVMSTSRTIRG